MRVEILCLLVREQLGGGRVFVEAEAVAGVEVVGMVAAIWGHVRIQDVWVLGLSVIVANHDVWVGDVCSWCG